MILTPPAPGNQRGAIWSDKLLQQANWATDVEFRANGPERGGGNLQIWLARNGPREVATGSIYTISKFEGLALVIDGHGGYGGMIRGFLNDGTTDFKSSNVDSLSFGHCNFAYRNLGRPSQVKLRHSDSNFRVEVDGKLCFESDKVRIPQGYNLGITAASADNPDSFEVFKLVVLTQDEKGAQSGNQNQNQNADQNNNQQQQQQQQDKPRQVFGRAGQNAEAQQSQFDDEIPDESAEKFTSSKAQFADLHNRLQSVNHHLSTIFRTIATQGTVGEKRHEETSIFLGELKGRLQQLDKLDQIEKLFHLEQKIISLERELHAMRSDLTQKVRDSERAVKSVVLDKHDTMQEHIKAQAPGHTKLIIVIIGSQLLLAAAFIIYKRRKSSPKKYL